MWVDLIAVIDQTRRANCEKNVTLFFHVWNAAVAKGGGEGVERRKQKKERQLFLSAFVRERLNFNVFHPLCIPSMADAGSGNLRH